MMKLWLKLRILSNMENTNKFQPKILEKIYKGADACNHAGAIYMSDDVWLFPDVKMKEW